MYLIEVKDVSKIFRLYKKAPGLIGAIRSVFSRKYTDFHAISHISLHIEEGELNYFQGGDPPENLAICTDIIARAFVEAGFNLKDLVYEDIKDNFDKYPIKEIWNRSFCDPNIDYRRIQNLEIFFNRNAKVLDILFNASDEQNLNSWLPGDVVFFDMDRIGYSDNVGIISDNTTRDGVPKVIYNYIDPEYTVEKNILQEKIITGHYRYPK